jgi:hypothetical protein
MRGALKEKQRCACASDQGDLEADCANKSVEGERAEERDEGQRGGGPGEESRSLTKK